MRNPYETLSLYSDDNNKNPEKLSILYQSFVSQKYTRASGNDIYILFDAALLFYCHGMISYYVLEDKRQLLLYQHKT